MQITGSDDSEIWGGAVGQGKQRIHTELFRKPPFRIIRPVWKEYEKRDQLETPKEVEAYEIGK
jgi:hypothetical protein